MRTNVLLGSCVSLLAFIGCQGQSIVDVESLECGPGTVEQNGVCVADGSGGGAVIQCGPGTVEKDGFCLPEGSGGSGGGAPVDTTAPVVTVGPSNGAYCGEGPGLVTLSANEPATIYYTTDGSEPTKASKFGLNVVELEILEGTLKYFALDAAGNASAVETYALAHDVEAPLAPTKVTGALKSGMLEFTWKNPSAADFGGVAIFSTLDEAPMPEPCSTLKVGDMLGRARVEYVGNAETAMVPRGLGMRAYYLVAFDALGNYSPFVSALRDANIVDAGPQVGAIEIKDPTTNPVASVTSKPTGLEVTASASYVDGILAVSLTAKNTGFGFALNAPKVFLDMTSQGTPQGSTGSVASKPFWRPSDGAARAIDIDGERTFKLELKGIDGSKNPLKLDLRFTNSPILLHGTSSAALVADTETRSAIGSSGGLGIPTNSNQGNQRNQPKSAIVTPDARRMLFVNHNAGAVSELLLGTLKRGRTAPASRSGNPFETTGKTLVGDWSNGLVITANGSRCRNGGNKNKSAGYSDFVALDAVTLEEVARIELLAHSDKQSPTHVSISPDGKYYAVTVSAVRDSGTPAMLFLIDRATLKLIDASPNDPNSLGIVFSNTANGSINLRQLRSAEWLDETTLVLVPYRQNNQGNRPVYQLTLDLVGGNHTVIPYNDATLAPKSYDFYPEKVGGSANDGKGTVLVAAHRGDCNQSQGIQLITKATSTHYSSQLNGSNWFQSGESCPESSVVAFDSTGTHYYVSSRNFDYQRAVLEFAVTDPATPVASIAGMFGDNRGHWMTVSSH